MLVKNKNNSKLLKTRFKFAPMYTKFSTRRQFCIQTILNIQLSHLLSVMQSCDDQEERFDLNHRARPAFNRFSTYLVNVTRIAK
jgi:hypothetical protein